MLRALQPLALVALGSVTCALAEEASNCAAQEQSVADEPEVADVQALLSISRSTSTKVPSFASFIAEYGHTYVVDSEEYEMRRTIFEDRLEQIRNHNSNGHRRWNAGVNHLTDRTDAELSQLRGLRAMKSGGGSAGTVGVHRASLDQVENAVIADEKLWTHLDAAKADTNQKHCGSCWAVTAATVLRANAEINGYDRDFSAQELVDCVPNPHHCGGDGGCKGSTVELAMNWVMERGLATSAQTPYKAEDTTCKKEDVSLLSHDGDHYGQGHLEDMIAVGFHKARSQDKAGLAIGLLGWERLPENKYEPLLRAVATTGTVAVSVAGHDWHTYDDGIFDGCKRDAVIDHAVTLIGYGKAKHGDDKYWIIKNSWGLHWGEKGNIRLLRHEGSDQHCGTDHQPESGTGCDGGPKEVRVCGMCGILYDSVVPHFSKRV